MMQSPALRGADIMQDRTCCGSGSGPTSQSKAFQRKHAKVILQQGNCVVRRENPIIQRRLRPCGTLPLRGMRFTGCGRRIQQRSTPRCRKQRRRTRKQHFLRAQLLHFFHYPPGRVLAAKLRCPKLAGRKLQRRKADCAACFRHSRQKIALLRGSRNLRRRARRDYPRYFPPHQRLRLTRVFHLLAQCDLESLANELGDVPFGGVIGNPAHGYLRAFFFIARGQGDLQLACAHNGVLEKHLVKIAKTEENQSVGVLLLDGSVLPHQRRGLFIHCLKANASVCADYISRGLTLIG